MDRVNGTPRAQLKFANRVYTSSPQVGDRRFGTPPASSSRRGFGHDAAASNNLSQSGIDTARNIFRASTLDKSTANTRFAPSLPGNTLRKVFAPAATPDAKKLFRDSSAKATPRRTLAATTSAELFKMAIPEPPADLTGAALADKVPQDMEQQGSVFAEQFLADICPKEFNDLQRRQFFCILDLRRLKHAANEIFAKKDWKINIMNFAKEYEKSRSLIMLRYGLYEFKNIKPSAEILRKWRAAHGLQDEVEPTKGSPVKRHSKPSAKRKADDDLQPRDTALSESSANKRRATDSDAGDALQKNKRKTSPDGVSQPTKQQKTAPSATKAFFEKVAAKPATPTASATPSAKPLFSSASTRAAKSDASLSRSVLDKNAAGAQSNIFSYLSDASSAKNSGIDADGESESESEAEEESQEQSVVPSGFSAGTATQAAAPAFGAFTSKTSSLFGSGSGTPSVTSEARAGASLFDRITKGSDGQPIRVEEVESPAGDVGTDASIATAQTSSGDDQDAPANKTWTPDTPLKFAPQSSQGASSVFKAAPVSNTSIFGTSSNQPTSNIFGVTKKTDDQQKLNSVETDGGESDKENDAQSGPKSSALFKPNTTEGNKPSANTPAIFGGKTQMASIFGQNQQSATTNGSAFSSSTLFGNKPTEPSTAAGQRSASPEKSAAAQPDTATTGQTSAAPKAGGLFGGISTPSAPSSTAPKPASLFGATNGTTSNEPPKSSSIFGSSAKPASASLFGQSTASNMFSSSQSQTNSSLAPAPTFSFGAQPASNQAPKSGLTAPSAAPNPMFGSPMKQDDPSPGKRAFGDAMQEDQPSPVKKPFNSTSAPLSFGASQQAGSTPVTSTPSFTFGGNADKPATTTGPSLFGANATPASSMNFNFGGPPANSGAQAGSGSSFQFGAGGTSTPATGGMFNFQASTPSTQPAATGGFSFGGSNTASAAPTPAGDQGSNPFTFNGPPKGRVIKKPNFGASKARARMSASPAPPSMPAAPAVQSGAPTFSFTSATPQSHGQQSIFGAGTPGPSSGPIFQGLQAAPGGASTTGTNSPFNFGGASSLATTPATGTPEPGTDAEAAGSKAKETGAEGEVEPVSEQINLVEGGPGEEDEEVVHDVRAKVMKFEAPTSDDGEGGEKKAKSPWSTKGVGPLRVLKHKTTGAVRVLLRKEPTGQVALNRVVLPDVSYKPEEKYVKLTTSNDSGSGLETWMVQVKTKELAKTLAEALEEHKSFNKK